jgi:hypothetical protein
MKASKKTRKPGWALATAALFMVVVRATGMAETTQTATTPNFVLWDTGSPIGDKFNAGDRSAWKVVPDDLLLLEADPPKASSDPGYYGRDYSLKGDAVVETPALTVVFWSAKGCVTIYPKQDPSRKDGQMGDKIAALSPIGGESKASTISRVEVVRNTDDEIVLRASFSADSPGIAGVFSFDKSGIIEVKPGENMKSVRLASSLEYGVVPGFIGDDLIFGGQERPETNTIAVPSENLFVGLLPGENTELVLTWPKGKQRVSLHFAQDQKNALISSMDFDNDGQSFYLAALSAPGIWHKESLTTDYLEKDVQLQWKRPYPARWKTQLYEEDLKTTFAFRESRGEVWRGVAGSFVYPVWFSQDNAFCHLGKKIQPKGEAVIYCLEGRGTPLSIFTPSDILRQTLGRQAAEPILDFAGRELRTHHRRAGEGVRRACTCGCTEAIQTVFESGEEVSKKEYIQGALDDMIYFVHRHVERINDYRQFADGLLKTIQETRQASADLKPYLDGLEEIARQIPDEYDVQKENMKTFGYADDLSGRTLALTARKDPANLKAYMELLKAWRAMGGAQDYVLAKCHVITRNLYRAAGYGCGSLPGALSFAEQVRARCRQILRNPDGYEVWADY